MCCIIKVPVMINQIHQVVKANTLTKITVENFQKRQGKIFTSESTIIELDNTVNNLYLNFFLHFQKKEEIKLYKLKIYENLISSDAYIYISYIIK